MAAHLFMPGPRACLVHWSSWLVLFQIPPVSEECFAKRWISYGCTAGSWGGAIYALPWGCSAGELKGSWPYCHQSLPLGVLGNRVTVHYQLREVTTIGPWKSAEWYLQVCNLQELNTWKYSFRQNYYGQPDTHGANSTSTRMMKILCKYCCSIPP